MEIICDRDVETYWCELCREYTICDRAEQWMKEHGYPHVTAKHNGRFNCVDKTKGDTP